MKNNARLLAALAVISITSSSFAQVLVSSNSYSQNFASLGSSASATLPSGWALNNAATYFTGSVTATTLSAGTTGTGSLTGTSSGGYYNFGNGINSSSTDRALGFLTTGSFTSPRNLFFAFTNDTGSTITGLDFDFDYEKYRTGTRAFSLAFFVSTDGSSWASQSLGDQSYAADGANAVVNPPTTISKSITLSGLGIADGANYFLRWSYTGTGGSTNAQGLALDNFVMSATLAVAPIPEPSTYAAIFGAVALVGIAVRRHRQRKTAQAATA